MRYLMIGWSVAIIYKAVTIYVFIFSLTSLVEMMPDKFLTFSIAQNAIQNYQLKYLYFICYLSISTLILPHYQWCPHLLFHKLSIIWETTNRNYQKLSYTLFVLLLHNIIHVWGSHSDPLFLTQSRGWLKQIWMPHLQSILFDWGNGKCERLFPYILSWMFEILHDLSNKELICIDWMPSWRVQLEYGYLIQGFPAIKCRTQAEIPSNYE